jgi:hypothetical protein
VSVQAHQLVEAIIARDQERHVIRQAISETEYNEILQTERGILGGGSLWLPKGRRKLTIGTDRVRPSEVAREWLRQSGVAPGVVPRRRVPLPDAPPLYYDPSKARSRDWAYVDIKSAYWSIYKAIPLETTFTVGVFKRAIYPGDSPIVNLEDYDMERLKAIRVSAFGSMKSTRIRTFDKGKLVDRPFRNPLLAPHLTGLTLAILHELAADIVSRFEVPVFHTDGFLLPFEDARQAIKHLDVEWCLEARVKEKGYGVPYGLGDYEWRPTCRQCKGRPLDKIARGLVTRDDWLALVERWHVNQSH